MKPTMSHTASLPLAGKPEDEALARTICHFIEGRSDDVNAEMFETVLMAIEWHRLKTGEPK